MDAEPLWLFVWATAVSAVPSRTRLSLMAKKQHNSGSCSFGWPEMRLRLSEVKPRTGPNLLAKIANRQSAIANCTLSSFQFNLSGNCFAQVKGE